MPLMFVFTLFIRDFFDAMVAVAQEGGLLDAENMPPRTRVPHHRGDAAHVLVDLQQHRRRRHHLRAGQAAGRQGPRDTPLLYGVAVLFLVYFLRGPLEGVH